MNETDKSTESVDETTDTFTSSLHDNGHYQLTSSEDNVQGAGHRETSYFITLPNDHTNINDSLIKLKFRYSKNLNFNRALATVYVNNTIVGSKKLSSEKADGDTMTISVPRGIALGNSFQVRIAFDLEMLDQNTSDNADTPWAQVEPQSSIYVKSERGNDLLFSNYPTLFINNQTYDNLAVVIPKKLNNYDFQTLTNIFNLIGNFSKSNTGKIQFYTGTPSKNVLRNSNVIVVGSPENNPMVKSLNSKLYFKYSNSFNRIISNEKLSIEKDYGKTIGTDQLLRSPYNDKKGLLVVTGPSSKATYLASTQINFQKNIQQYNGDAIIVDANNAHYSYRFKKNKAIDKSLDTKNFVNRNSQLLIYLGFAIVALIMIGIGIFLTLRKQSINNGGNKSGK
ncbi:cellulose biosynthesis cyclic di-GMP-binding regulatory protein BcsB [Companilactobacillus huachuanensis]|uniref:Cellulose biosynthesis cyclic di-GMP-binding regulatory protein BcsB n=2 Tax=Companilactobacillus huachuanensis TaxID=2559914 RepID=A0ABW1RQ27_9LACO